eukprot:986334-Alexandrium_andersonii.AAC.1
MAGGASCVHVTTSHAAFRHVISFRGRPGGCNPTMHAWSSGGDAALGRMLASSVGHLRRVLLG